jgi:von Willebrand factor type A domain
MASPRRSPWGALAIVAATLFFPLSAQAAQAAQAGLASQPNITGPPLDIVMLVDESASLSDADVAREIQAAGTIAQTPLNPRSRVTVVGFGGVNGVRPDQDPTAVVCQPTITDGTASFDYLSRCVSGLHRRTDAEGDDTDYAAALAQAMNYLGGGTPASQQSPAGATKAIFLMTDGGLDVHRDPQYLPDWQTAARHAVDLQLQAAEAAHVEIWPLGFGAISPADHRYLDELAAGGSQDACDSRAVSRPHATVAQGSAVALAALYDLYASAGCLGTSQGSSAVLGPGQTRTMEVSIPAIASAGAISVNKGDSAIEVEYVTPDGKTVTGGPAFRRSGDNTAVDVLHVTDPAPGTWQVRLTAPAGLSRQLVSVTAFWQGSVRAVITAFPPSARESQPVKVTLSVLGPHGPILDQATLSQIQVGVTVIGDGLRAPVNVPVSNAGEGQAATGAGDYRGTFTAPARDGQLVFTGTAQGYGLYPTHIPTTVAVGDPSSLLQATVQFTQAGSSVLPGQSVHGQIVFTNQTGSARKVRLTLSASPAYATVSSPAGAIDVPSGSSAAGFSIVIARNSPRGSALLRASVVAAGHPGTVDGNGVLTITVVSPPGLLTRYGPWIAAGLAVLLIMVLAVLSRRRRKREETDVRGLSAGLWHDDGSPACAELKPRGGQADTFRFVIREDGPQPRLVHVHPGDRAFSARRAGLGKVKVVAPDGGKYDISTGTAGEPLPSGWHLAFSDTRMPSARHPREDAFTGPGADRTRPARGSASPGTARDGQVKTSQADPAPDSAGDWY